MKPIRLKWCALMLVFTLAAAGLCGCRFQSVSNQIKDLYLTYLDSVVSPSKAPDYENFRRIYPLKVWETIRDDSYGGSENDMKTAVTERIAVEWDQYIEKVGFDLSYTVNEVERTKVEGDELQENLTFLTETYGIESGEIKEIDQITVQFVMTGIDDTITVTHRQKLMKIDGKWYFCPVKGSEDPFHLFNN